MVQVCASKVYTSAEFKREKDNFQSLCKNLERAETKKWVYDICSGAKLNLKDGKKKKEKNADGFGARLDSALCSGGWLKNLEGYC